MDLQLPNSDRLCFGNHPVKKRSKRKPANVKENMELAGLLFKLARASRRSNNNGSNSSSSMSSPKTLTVQMKKKKKAVDVAEQVVFPRATSSSSRRYVCSVCNMSFSSHQALGGHKSSHKLKKQKTATVLDHDVEVHKYHACHESFPIGQALGGHMRGHCGEVRDINLNVPDLPGMEISSLSDDVPRIPLLLRNETSPSPN